MNPILILVGLHVIPGLSQVFQISQDPKLLIRKTGESAELSCQHNDDTYFAMFWYQQKPHQGLKLMVHSTGAGDGKMEDEFDAWSLNRTETTKAALTLLHPKAQDSAVYFCAASRDSGNERQYFGSGTILTILEEGQEPKKPNVSIYRPNKQELKDHNFISLVCVASDFFPEHVKIQWFVNSVKRINVYEPTPQKKGNNSYSTSKRLTLTREEYFNPDSTFRCVAAFLDGSLEASEEIKGETDCGVSKEFYTMYINQGKISYIMILCKSGLYALVVLVLVWRKKGYCALLLKGIADASNLYKPELHG
ncbi:M1-specific T cell receptor beta chain-like isoform X5 [Bufo bufo]|uniref:M1-specific T cell receptor beta chain-like isoform X5 n=1 Tax=Bufo bufo TaxID=8384 RepID=UPI001ABE5B3E|nr:M1-specific T cell receptor beta chain-like isoform X5 [Bufo bufo]